MTVTYKVFNYSTYLVAYVVQYVYVVIYFHDDMIVKVYGTCNWKLS